MEKETLRKRLFNQFETCRIQSLNLIKGLTLQEQLIQVDELRGPLAWDLGHSAWFEELWLLREINGDKEIWPGSDVIYDNEKNHKRTRQVMPLLNGEKLLNYLEKIRSRSLKVLADCDFSEENPLLKNGFAFDLVLNHEFQHQELMIITMQQLLARPHPSLSPSPFKVEKEAKNDWKPGTMVRIPEGEWIMGSKNSGFAYDNEKPAHTVSLPRFAIDRFKTSNVEYIEFIESGGYQNKKFWADEGWAWIQQNEITLPAYWRYDSNEGWLRKNFGGIIEPLRGDESVCNVTWYEASAYAKFRGKRLPTEAEWERAASFNEETGKAQMFPWGNEEPNSKHGNFYSERLGPSPVWEYPNGDTVTGLRQLIGNAWEWTSSVFQPYQGFKAFPYPEYSQIFLDSKFKVLKGGSWATSPLAVRNSFRNFYQPQHRHVISGIRCAKTL